MTALFPNLPIGPEPLDLVYTTPGSDQDRLLTIVIGSYNHCRYLADAFAAIEATQNIGRLSLIFIDDGSQDGTMEFVCAYRFDPRLFVRILSKKNAGLCDSLSSGLALSNTAFSCFIASDDCYVPQDLDMAISRLVSLDHSDICWVCQAVYLGEKDGQFVYGKQTKDLISASPEYRFQLFSISYPKPMLLQSSIFGTDLLRRAGAWSDHLDLDDWPTFLRVARLATTSYVEFRFVSDLVLCKQRLHANGIHNNLDRQLKVCLQVVNGLVEKQYRADARARVYLDIGLIHLFERRFGKAFSLFFYGLRANPTLSVAKIVPSRLIHALIRRARRFRSTTTKQSAA